MLRANIIKMKRISHFLKIWDLNTLYIPLLYIVKGEVIMVKVKSLRFLIHEAPLNQPNTIMGAKFKHYGKKKETLLSAFVALPQSEIGAQPRAGVVLTHRRGARRAASGVGYSGTRSGSCGAGTAGRGSLQSAWGSRPCCRAGTRSSPPGSPGRRWTV